MTVKQWFQRAHLPTIFHSDHSTYDNPPDFVNDYIDELVAKYEGVIVEYYEEWSAGKDTVYLTCQCLEGDETQPVMIEIVWTFPFKFERIDRLHRQ